MNSENTRLTLGAQSRDEIMIGPDITLTIISIGDNKVRLAFSAPPCLQIMRTKILNAAGPLPDGIGEAGAIWTRKHLEARMFHVNYHIRLPLARVLRAAHALPVAGIRRLRDMLHEVCEEFEEADACDTYADTYLRLFDALSLMNEGLKGEVASIEHLREAAKSLEEVAIAFGQVAAPSAIA